MPRKRRSDYGEIRLSERDVYLLTWIGDQSAVTVDLLHRLVNWYNLQQDDDPVTSHTIKWLVNRWQKAGWIEKRKILADYPAFIWLTATGLEQAGLDYPYYKPSFGLANHIYQHNRVRLYVMERAQPGLFWRSERRIKAERDPDDNRHLVDSEIIYLDGEFQGWTVGIEIELSLKTKDRLTSILQQLKQDYETVWYFIADDIFDLVGKAIKKIPDHDQSFLTYRITETDITEDG